MDQATQATTPIAPTEPLEHDATRASYERAKALADRLVGQVPTLPNAVETHRSFALDTFEARLHFGAGLTAGRGVLETAALTNTEVTREEKRDGKGDLIGFWIGIRTVVDGVPLSAWALTDAEDADQLLQPGDSEVTQPIPTVATSPIGVVVPAITPVVPLPTVQAAPVTLTKACDDGGDGEARCVRCGCTEYAACEGGCYWVPNEDMVDLCSACASPQQIAAMVFTPVSAAAAQDGAR